MNDAAVRQIAQSDPVPNLTESWGRWAADTRKAVDTLTRHLRSLAKVEAELLERGLTVSTDLGPIGNAAAAARRDLERTSDAITFEMPRV